MTIRNRLLYMAGRRHLGHALHHRTMPTEVAEFRVRCSHGHDLYCHLHRPREEGVYPAVVIVPGANSPGTAYDRPGVVTADEIACLGFAVVHYDPGGRGRSGGREDFWGEVHRRELADVLWRLHEMDCTDRDLGMTVFSFSIGIIIATGALAFEHCPPVRLLYDWEGPSDRFIATNNDRHPPLRDYPTSNDTFWSSREAVTMIGKVGCAYFRYQANKDHVQGTLKKHAIDMVNAATLGRPCWTRLNDNPPNKTFDNASPHLASWVPQKNNHRETLLGYFLESFEKAGCDFSPPPTHP